MNKRAAVLRRLQNQIKTKFSFIQRPGMKSGDKTGPVSVFILLIHRVLVPTRHSLQLFTGDSFTLVDIQ